MRRNSLVLLTVEGPLVGNVVDEEDAHCAAVVGGGYRPEAFLAGCVPLRAKSSEHTALCGLQRTNNLQLDAAAVELNCADLKVDADGGDEGGRPCVVAEAQQQTRLADPRVPDEEQLRTVSTVPAQRSILRAIP